MPVGRYRVDAEWVRARLSDPRTVLIDARSGSEFASGHIPGATNVDWAQTVAAGRFRARETLRALHPVHQGGQTWIAYCQTGSRASVTWVALTALGYHPQLYDGSWEEWSALDLPREP